MMQNKNFKDSIKEIFDRYKRKNVKDPLNPLPITEGERLVGFLRPFTVDFAQTLPQLVEVLTRWRKENPTLGAGKFEPTPERTLKWLDTHVLGRDDRLLFLIIGLDGTWIGHIGFSNFDFEERSAEVDSVLRGVKGGHPGMMTLATKALVEWGYEELKLDKVKLSVYADNDPVIKFYEKAGFRRAYVKPLYKVNLGDEERWELAPENYSGVVEKEYLYMEHVHS
jgi:RimJ/RimL family protein N-acetyltransferase